MNATDLERIYDEHAASLFAFFRRFAADDTEARDYLQSWFLKIAQWESTGPEIENERAFLLKAAHRHALDLLRRTQTRQKYDRLAALEPSLPRFSIGENPDRELLRVALERALDELPDEQQLIVQLKLWDGLTFAEIADVLGLSANTAASRFRYGIAKLQEALRPIYQELKT